ncbi:MAG TPA: cupin domain-containing protein [Chthoniobacterales bacterium]|nr:cupin domain-containing protein [Chthoniobacterales bacterium]
MILLNRVILAGGSPHMHFACSEAYLVIKGRGSVQTLTNEGLRETPLRSGSLLWFTPGVIHRLINGDGHLEIFAVMENAGLPESGDSVLTFPEKIGNWECAERSVRTSRKEC